MPRFVNQISIRGDIDRVFDFITTPDHWPRLWAPWSRAIEPRIGHPLAPEDPPFVERAVVLGLTHDFTWQCVAARRPRFFLARGELRFFGAASVFLQYDLGQEADQVRYRRTVLFAHHSICTGLMDPLLKPIYFGISARALRSTRRIFETEAAQPDDP